MKRVCQGQGILVSNFVLEWLKIFLCVFVLYTVYLVLFIVPEVAKTIYTCDRHRHRHRQRQRRRRRRRHHQQ